MSERRVLGFKPALGLEWRGREGHDETQQRGRKSSLLDFVNAESAVVISVPLLKEGVDVETLGLHLPCHWDCADYNENNEPDQ